MPCEQTVAGMTSGKKKLPDHHFQLHPFETDPHPKIQNEKHQKNEKCRYHPRRLALPSGSKHRLHPHLTHEQRVFRFRQERDGCPGWRRSVSAWHYSTCGRDWRLSKQRSDRSRQIVLPSSRSWTQHSRPSWDWGSRPRRPPPRLVCCFQGISRFLKTPAPKAGVFFLKSALRVLNGLRRVRIIHPK